MATWEDSIEALKARVEEILASKGIVTAPHALGEKARSTHGEPPAYVWVPDELRGGEEAPFTPGQEQDDEEEGDFEVRGLADLREGLQIFCWGKTRRQVSAMRQNLIAAIHEAALADFRIEGGANLRPGTAFNQLGELFRLDVSVRFTVLDGYVDLDGLEEPEADGIVPTDIEGRVGLAESVDDEDGPYPITTTTAAPSAG